MQSSLPQPETLQLLNSNGVPETFTLWVPYQVINSIEGRSIGPLYRLGMGDGPVSLLYLPDAGYLHAGLKLTGMNPIIFPGPVPKDWNPNEQPEPWNG
jgi:hypothetical protein